MPTSVRTIRAVNAQAIWSERIGARRPKKTVCHAVVVHGAQDGEQLPVTSGHSIVHPLSTLCTGVRARHLRRNTAFIQVNQVFDRQARAGG